MSFLPMVYGALCFGAGRRQTVPRAGSQHRDPVAPRRVLRPLAPDRRDDPARRKVTRQPDFRLTFLATAATLGAPVLGTYPWWRRALLARIADADIPTMVVWGDADAVLPASHLEAAVAALPNASSHLFPDTGHMPQLERAEEFAELAAAFVAKAGRERSDLMKRLATVLATVALAMPLLPQLRRRLPLPPLRVTSGAGARGPDLHGRPRR